LIAKRAMSKPVGKMQMRGNHGNLLMVISPGTCHSEFLVEIKYTYLEARAHYKPRGGWEGAKQRQSDRQS